MNPSHAKDLNAGLSPAGLPRLGHDFIRISIHRPVAGVIQKKLAANQSGDQYEQEANHVSELVMRKLEPPRQSVGGEAVIQGQDHEPLHLKRVGEAGMEPSAVPPGVHEVLVSPGQPLDGMTRAFMEPRFGHDFSRVRVHRDEMAARSAEDIQARAYTHGEHLVFAEGQFAPATTAGRTLLAHELSHVVQQNQGSAMIQRSPTANQPGKTELKAAQYRGQIMARRIRVHGRLSKEAREKIDRELASFEGAAKDAYLKEVKPALLEVNEIQMPADWLVPDGPQPVELVASFEGPQYHGGTKGLSDQQIYGSSADVSADQETKQNEAASKARLLQYHLLRQRTQGWGEDQQFAVDLLRSVFSSVNVHDMGAISDAIRQPILDHYEAWLKAQDKAMLDKCAKNPPDMLTKGFYRFQGEELCESAFKTDHSHGPNALHELERLLKIYRNSGHVPADKVYQDVLEYRRKVDPKLVLQGMQGPAIAGAVAGRAGVYGGWINTETTPIPPEQSASPPGADLGSTPVPIPGSGGNESLGNAPTLKPTPPSGGESGAPVGRLGDPMTVQSGANTPATINGIDYTGHALDQMQSRGLTPSVVEDTLSRGAQTPGYDGATVYTTEQARVIVNPNGSIKTVYPQ